MGVHFLRKWLSIIAITLCLSLCLDAVAEDTSEDDFLIIDFSFYCANVTDDIFVHIQDEPDSATFRKNLTYLHILYTDPAGETQDGELIVDEHVAFDVLDVFETLHKANYIIESISLVSRAVNTPEHSLGLAIDIYTPQAKVNEPHLDHDDLAYKLLTEIGFEWSCHDNCQHFEIPTNLIEEWYP